MVRHHNPLPQQITLTMEELQRAGDELCDFWTTQMTRARTLVEVSLDLTPKVAVEGFFALSSLAAGCLQHLDLSQSLSALCLESQEHLSGERIRQAESDEVVCTLTFDVRKITAKVDAAAQWVGVRLPDAGGAEFVSHSLKTRIVGFRGHSICKLSGLDIHRKAAPMLS